jgi:hypothetical protein
VQALAMGRVDEALVPAIGQPRRVHVRDHREHARQSLGRPGVDGGDAAQADRAGDQHSMGLARLVELGRVAGGTGDLGRAVDARQRLSDRHRAHAVSPVIASARTTVRRSSSTL